MDKKLNKALAGVIDQALTDTDRTMQERVATGALAVWNETRQNEPFSISEADAASLAFNAQKKDTLARNKRLNVQVDVPEAMGYEHKKFTTFDNNVARLKLTIINAPHLPKALKIVDKLIHAGVVKQSGLVLHKAMEAVGAGSGETWEADKRKKSADSITAHDKREADKVTPEGFNKRLKTLVDEALEHSIVMNPEGVFVEDKPSIDDMPDKPTLVEAIDEAAPTVMDADAIAAMMDMPQFQHAMAAFMTKLTTK